MKVKCDTSTREVQLIFAGSPMTAMTWMTENRHRHVFKWSILVLWELCPTLQQKLINAALKLFRIIF